MKIEIAKMAKMAESGNSLLRLLQNKETPRLDLLVRETLQNCLDAGDRAHDSVRVEIKTGKIDTAKLATHFEAIDKSLIHKYPGKRDYISIRDMNTNGLTGPIRQEDVEGSNFGNLLKLIYEISKPQSGAGAGGSWGLGKTVFFRIGIGLVIYYSRIRNEKGGFESRLAAALVEDEQSEDTLLPKMKKGGNRGIAWWGERDSNSGESHNLVKSIRTLVKTKPGELDQEWLEPSIPVTNEQQILKFLGDIGFKPYKDDETGTLIIIPFVDRDTLLKETEPSDTEEARIPYWCKTSMEDYLKVAVQRWYAPRIDNAAYCLDDGKKSTGHCRQYLDISINGNTIKATQMEPVFRLVQCLYNARPEPAPDSFFDGTQIISKPVKLQKVFKAGSAVAGWINYIKVTNAQLKMTAPDNKPSPYYYINKTDSDAVYNDPILLYTRRPGMVVNYETTGDWTDSIPKTAPGEYIIGLFIANSSNEMLQNMPLEEYIRGSEKADHMKWEDWTVDGKKARVISNIKNNVRKKIKEDYAVITQTHEEKKNFGLGKLLADALLPPTGFTSWDEARGGGKGTGGTGGDGSQTSVPANPQNKTSHIILKQAGLPVFTDDYISQPVLILYGKKRTTAVLEMAVALEHGNMTADEWTDKIGTDFPIRFIGLELQKVSLGRAKGTDAHIFVDEDNPELLLDGITLKAEFIKQQGTELLTGVKLNVPTSDGYVIRACLRYTLTGAQGTIVLKEEN